MRVLMKIGLILFTSLLLFPSTVSLGHFFANHEHTYCNHYSDSHFHQENPDCDLFKFQQTSLLGCDFQQFEPYPPAVSTLRTNLFYEFVSDYQKLPYELRGPPHLS